MFKLTIKTTEQHRSTVFIVNFEHISRLLLMFLLLNLNTQMLVEIRRLVRSVNILCSGSLHQCQLTSLWCLYYWIWKYLHIRVALLLLTVKFTFWLLFTFTMFTLARLNTDWLQNLKFLNFFSAFFRYPPLSVGKKCSFFFGKFDVLCFCVTSVLRFAFLPYYRQIFISFLIFIYFDFFFSTKSFPWKVPQVFCRWKLTSFIKEVRIII